MVQVRVSAWLAEILPAAVPPFDIVDFPGGRSMLTSRLTDSTGASWVLRRPPAKSARGGAHDVGREARVMAAVRDHGVPVPALRYVGTGDDPLGVPCHITDFVDGRVLEGRDVQPPAPAVMTRATQQIVDVLARLHAIDPDAVGLGDLGPRTDYVARQLHRWRGQIAGAAGYGDELSRELDAIAAALDAFGFPQSSPRIVHGDFRLGNAIVAADGGIAAILDWELSTLGEPLADLGMLTAFWTAPPSAMLGAVMPTSFAGSIGTTEVLDRYAAASEHELGDFSGYLALACWRLACTGYLARSRYAAGVMNDRIDSSTFEAAVARWAAAAREALAAR
ncbi:phosphotransferase family protein [Nakamurella lactea]|uniref:phosphotransferase family protein n=1 Tax=Nakamurella lactea TaxID=459515 RepID=UPI000687A8B5|nr:phosphotransferase family protein [Nakamurella lactea]